ncbi:uncharacterized protein HMPREF1541_03789 [Cyphellophora europaea CBS 101466]|uniref:Uncharacterized protein n=1 Tax=Cyphellophora europaea (strain CBS 101466) TaxID=1220924 RepID=W2RZS7_CYPE1|nr:uncharacterized protein HMPREF1541_03789 [Cyphellophora europaea CBS 101466]ETN41850.1 hypothetical protein HMPREF1541_03789 [Cyphellophora europaea CBS 101466]
MGILLDLALLLVGLQSIPVLGQAGIVDEEIDAPSKSPSLSVAVSASFPDAEIFGIKLVNGKPTDSLISFSNQEPEPVTVQFVGGSLWTPDFDPQGSRVVRNLTTKQYAVEIPAGEKQTLPYRFQTNMHPQELRLNLAAVVSKDETFYTMQAYNGTISVVDPDSSFFDPQMIFLYFFLVACAVGVGYAFYHIWVVPYFPQLQQKKSRGQKPIKKAEPVEVDAAGPAVTTSSKGYDESWIPAHHLQRPEARRVKSGGPRPKSKGKE